MKKFLRIKLPASEKDVPVELDAAILSAAAMRAKNNRRKRVIFKVVFPGLAVGSAAAAAAVIAMMPTVQQPVSAPHPVMIQTIGKNSQTPPAPTVRNIAPSTADMLQLADTSELELECYNLATMSDFAIEGDLFTI